MKTSYAAITTFSLFLTITVFGQQAKLEGHVSEIAGGKEIPVIGVRVVSPGGQSKETDSKGHFVIDFPNSVRPGQAMRIEVSRAGWVVRDPLFGECTTKDAMRNFELLKVAIVPKGSPLALEPKQLSKVIDRWANERVGLREQVAELGRQRDEYAFLREYAEKYGVTLEQFKAAADDWAKIKESDDTEERALKEYWLKNYDRAASLAREAAIGADDELEQAEKAKIEASRKVIRRYQLEGNAWSAAYKFRDALAAYYEIDKRFSTKKLSKEDLPEEWAGIKFLLGNTKGQLGIRVEGEESQLLLAESVKEYRHVFSIYTREQFPFQWAATQNNLGNALSAQAARAEGADGARLMGEAVQAYYEALKVRTREQFPQDWAATQNNLGAALLSKARAAGPDGARLLGEAVQAFRQVLQVFTREHLPQDWAATQYNLGVALSLQGALAKGADGARLLAEAVQTLLESLKVFTREQLPQDWARTQNSLGIAYLLLKNWKDAAVSFESVLMLYPSHRPAYGPLTSIYHEQLFEYAKAFELHQKWISRYPDDNSVLSAFVEAHFTTGRFSEFSQQVKPLLADPKLSASKKIPLQMIEIANLLALGSAADVPASLITLHQTIAEQKVDFQINWSFNGTLHFINQEEKFTPYRTWLNQFFRVAKAENRDAIIKALREAQAQFPNKI